MTNETYEIMEYDMEVGGKWYATVLHICNQKPIAVYRVPSDPPTYSEIENETTAPKG
jgi:hypothetical protein